MSTLEKFGILVILILVVIIGVVAVWGVGGDNKANPFESTPAADLKAGGAGTDTALAQDPGKATPDWPNGTPAAQGSGAAPASGGPVAPPALGASASPAAPEATATPAPAGSSSYTVKKGDTGKSIAMATLGDGNRWKEIMDANPGVDARRLKIGMVIRIPSSRGAAVVATGPKPTGTSVPKPNTFEPTSDGKKPNPEGGGNDPAQGTPAPAKKTEAPPAASAGSTREVEVHSGDTLYEIARRELGDPNLYYKILKANPGLDPKKLKVGQRINVPSDK